MASESSTVCLAASSVPQKPSLSFPLQLISQMHGDQDSKLYLFGLGNADPAVTSAFAAGRGLTVFPVKAERC